VTKIFPFLVLLVFLTMVGRTGFILPGLNLGRRVVAGNVSRGVAVYSSMRPAAGRSVWRPSGGSRSRSRTSMTAGSVAVKEEKSLPPVKYLSDYAPPAYFVESVDLTFELDDTETVVKSRIVIALNPKGTSGDRSIVLDGDKGLELVEGSLMLNGKVVPSSQFELTDSGLTIYESALPEASEALVVECSVKINPAANKALEGLYKSGGNFCTQCEAEGFRRITFYPDRPDVMSVFTTTIIADREKYPVGSYPLSCEDSQTV